MKYLSSIYSFTIPDAINQAEIIFIMSNAT